MFETLKNAFKVKEIRKKIFITLLILLVYRIGCYIPIPGLDAGTFEQTIAGNTFLELMNGITGGSLAQGTLFALGIGPYINASIIMQLLCVGIPALERLSKQGEEGKKKISQITRFLTCSLRSSNPSASSSPSATARLHRSISGGRSGCCGSS